MSHAEADALTRIPSVRYAVVHELETALERFDTFNSPHEGLAVIWEEFEELKAHVWENTGQSDAAMQEAIQIAAMAMRYVLDLDLSASVTSDDDD